MKRARVALVLGLLTVANPISLWGFRGVPVTSRHTATTALHAVGANDAICAPHGGNGATIHVKNLTAQPAALVAGSTITFTAAITSTTALSALIVSLEVYDASCSNVYAHRSTLNIAAQGSQRLAIPWSVPSTQPSGKYHVLVNVFSGNWAMHYAESCCSDLLVVDPSNTIALGAWIPGADRDPSVVDRYARLTGGYPRIINYYQSWLPPNPRDLNVRLLQAYQRRGVTPMISWEPDVPDRTILDGSYDPLIRQYAHDAATYGKPFYLRFAWEQNASWSVWSPGVNGNTAESFVAAWRHVHDIFVAEHATNVRWVWAPNIAYRGSISFASVYPGDAYVDWLGLDGYNWGPFGTEHSWTSGYQIFGSSIAGLMALSSKPIMISEIASTERGGDKAAWITSWFLRDLPAHFPRVRAVVWFDENKEQDWRVNSSSASLAAFRQVVASRLYQGRLP